MLTEYSPDVSVENVEARIPSGSACEIAVTSVLRVRDQLQARRL
jgi:hypothetical protein